MQAGEMSRYLVLYERPNWESSLRLNMNCNYDFEVLHLRENIDNDSNCLLMRTKMSCTRWLTVGSWIVFVVFLKKT